MPLACEVGQNPTINNGNFTPNVAVNVIMKSCTGKIIVKHLSFIIPTPLSYMQHTKKADKNIMRLWNIASANVIQNNFLE